MSIIEVSYLSIGNNQGMHGGQDVGLGNASNTNMGQGSSSLN